MKSLLFISTALTMCLLSSFYGQAQETETQNSVEQLTHLKEKIIQEEKEALKIEVESIHARLDSGEITPERAETLKKKAAEKHALNIENRIAIATNQMELIERNGADSTMRIGRRIVMGFGLEDSDNNMIFGLKIENDSTPHKKRKYDRRTTSGPNLAFGLNNAITEGESFNEADFKVGGSRFFEIGWSWKTRVFDNSNWLRVKYGIAFQFNGLKPKDNLYFVDTGEHTELQTHPIQLKKSKFRIDNLVVPFHFEFGPSEKIERDDYFRYKTDKKIKVGLGGYAGVNLGVRQKLKFKEDGERTKQKLKANYNTGNFVYGLSGYLGWGDTSIYMKYDLNTIFKDNPKDQRNISLGLRFDFD